MSEKRKAHDLSENESEVFQYAAKPRCTLFSVRDCIYPPKKSGVARSLLRRESLDTAI